MRTGPLLQEMPFHLEPAGPLVQASHDGVVVPHLLALIGPVAVVKDKKNAPSTRAYVQF